MHDHCAAMVHLGEKKVPCSFTTHDTGQHLGIGAFFVKQPMPDGFFREKRVAYRIAWSDDPLATLEV